MRKLFILLSLACLSINAHAQLYRQNESNPDIFHSARHEEFQRKNIILPEVNGYKAFTADLHSHTIYSDGNVTPELRVKEAWLDGLDILAVSDHFQSIKLEKKMVSVKNNTSIPHVLNYGGELIDLKPLESVTLVVNKSDDLKFTVETMWYSSEGHPVFEYKL